VVTVVLSNFGDRGALGVGDLHCLQWQSLAGTYALDILEGCLVCAPLLGVGPWSCRGSAFSLHCGGQFRVADLGGGLGGELGQGWFVVGLVVFLFKICVMLNTDCMFVQPIRHMGIALSVDPTHLPSLCTTAKFEFNALYTKTFPLLVEGRIG